MQSADSACPFCNGRGSNCRCNGDYFGKARSKQSLLGAVILRQKVWARSCLAEQRNRTLVCPTPSKIESQLASRASLKLYWPAITLLLHFLIASEIHGLASAMLDRYTRLKPFVNTHLKFGLSHHVMDSTSLVKSNGSLNTRVRSETHQYIRAFI